MSKVSPIAAYLTENNAITKKQSSNVWHFFSKEGLYLGRQIKIEQNGANAYIREVFGEGLKNLFYECKVIGQKCTYYKDDKSPIGVNILPVYSYVLTHSIDFINSKLRSVQVEKKLKNQMDLIAIERNIGVGIYNINKPFVYDEKKLLDETKEIKSSLKVNHTFN